MEALRGNILANKSTFLIKNHAKQLSVNQLVDHKISQSSEMSLFFMSGSLSMNKSM